MPADASPRRSDDELLATVHRRIATVRAARARRTFLALGAATAVTLLTATGVAVAGNGGEKHSAEVSSVASPTTSTEPTATTFLPGDTTTTEVTTTTATTVASVSAPATTIKPAPAPVPTTPRTTISRSGSVSPNALLFEAWPPNRNTARVYVSARGGATNGYVTHMTLTWGDGSPPHKFDYAPATCQDPSTAHPNDVQVVDDNHGYATTGTYTVELVVQAVRCDGQGAQTATTSTTVHYPSAPPSG